jgi:hypothetical protein
MRVEIVLLKTGETAGGKLADAILHFDTPASPGALQPVTFQGFGIWRPRGRETAPRVTMPARTITVGGQRHTFALVRPTTPNGLAALITLIQAAYIEHMTTDRTDRTDRTTHNRTEER